jgi:hypothetical protein
VAILASDDAKNRLAHEKSRARISRDARTRARAKTKHAKALEPAPALGFTAFRVFRLAVQFEQRLDV